MLVFSEYSKFIYSWNYLCYILCVLILIDKWTRETVFFFLNLKKLLTEGGNQAEKHGEEAFVAQNQGTRAEEEWKRGCNWGKYSLTAGGGWVAAKKVVVLRDGDFKAYKRPQSRRQCMTVKRSAFYPLCSEKSFVEWVDGSTAELIRQ